MNDELQDLKIENLKEALKTLQETTRDYNTLILRMEANTKATQALSEDVREIRKEMKTFNDFVSRWKGASFVIFTVGALASFLITQTVNIAKWITGN